MKLVIGKRYSQTIVQPHHFDGKKWHFKTDVREVILCAVYKGYAMIRRPRCMPYVGNVSDLSAIETQLATKQ